MAIGVNWAEIWGPVWASVWTNVPPIPPAPQTKAQGAGKSRRQQRRLVVEIDGSDFVVESEEEAVALLEKAKETAEENAKLAISRAAAAKRRKPSRVIADARKTLEVPSIIAPSIQAHADKILAEIRDTYESTMRSIEVAALLNKRDQDEEDDEDILLLMA